MRRVFRGGAEVVERVENGRQRERKSDNQDKWDKRALDRSRNCDPGASTGKRTSGVIGGVITRAASELCVALGARMCVRLCQSSCVEL